MITGSRMISLAERPDKENGYALQDSRDCSLMDIRDVADGIACLLKEASCNCPLREKFMRESGVYRQAIMMNRGLGGTDRAAGSFKATNVERLKALMETTAVDSPLLFLGCCSAECQCGPLVVLCEQLRRAYCRDQSRDRKKGVCFGPFPVASK